MPLYYHPENNPVRKFWGIKRIGPGQDSVVFQRDERNDEYGIYRTILRVKGDQIGGVVELQNGWLKPGTEDFGEDAAKVDMQVTVERPILHFGSDPAVAIGFMVLILDALRE